MNWAAARRLWHGLLGQSPKQPHRRLRSCLSVESLEDRTVPSVAGPIVTDDLADTDGTTRVNVAVLANDVAQAGTQIKVGSLRVVAGPQHGRANVNAAGEIVYQAKNNFTGTDTFRYRIKDNLGHASRGTVSVRVFRPVAAPDFRNTDGTAPVTLDVLNNDADPEGNERLLPSSVTVVANPKHGRILSIDSGTGAITYQANEGFMGVDSFKYTVADDHGGVSEPAEAYVRVFRPTAFNDLVTFNLNTPVVIDVVENDSDPEGNERLLPGSVTIVSNPQHGTVQVNPTTGEITYTPNTGFAGTDTFKYTIADDHGGVSLPGTVNVVGNRPDAVNDDSADTDGTTPVTISVLANDDPPVGTQLRPGSVQVIAGPRNGKATVNLATGAITYKANKNFTGIDTFRYQVRDNARGTFIATVSVRVNRPVAAPDFRNTDGTSPVTLDVLANDADPEGNERLLPGSVTIVAHPKHGQVTVNPTTGAVTYTADAGFIGVDSFKYTVADDHGGVSEPAEGFIRVFRPSAFDDFGQTVVNSPVVVDVVENDSDPEGNERLLPSSVTVVLSPLHGQVSVNPSTGEITYTPEAGFVGTDRFTYTISDDHGGVSLPGTVTIVTAPTLVP